MVIRKLSQLKDYFMPRQGNDVWYCALSDTLFLVETRAYNFHDILMNENDRYFYIGVL